MNNTTESGPQRNSEPPTHVRVRLQPEPLVVERPAWQAVDLATIIERTKTNWRFGLWVFAIGCLITAVVVLLRKPLYRSEATIAYREGIQNNYVGQEGPDPLKTLASRLRETLLARPNLIPIIDEFKLYPSKMERGGHVAAVDELRLHIQFRTRSPDTFVISFESTNQDLVAPVTERLASVLVEELARSGKSQARITADFLGNERLRLEDQLQSREKELAMFLADHPEFAQEAKPGASILAAEREAGPDLGLAALERQLPRLRSSLERPRTGRVVDPKLEAAKTQAEQELRAAQQNLTDQSSRFTALHPDVQAASRRVNAARAQLAQAEAAIAAAPAQPGGEQAATEAQLKQLQSEIAARKSQLRTEKAAKKASSSQTVERIVAAETDHARLTREVADAKARVEAIDINLATARMAESSKANGYGARIEVIDPAYRPPTPSSMRRIYMVLMGLGASLLLGVGLAASRGVLLDQRIYHAADVVRLPVPVLAVVPKPTPTQTAIVPRPPVRSPARLTRTLQGVGEFRDPHGDDNGFVGRTIRKLALPAKE